MQSYIDIYDHTMLDPSVLENYYHMIQDISI